MMSFFVVDILMDMKLNFFFPIQYSTDIVLQLLQRFRATTNGSHGNALLRIQLEVTTLTAQIFADIYLIYRLWKIFVEIQISTHLCS